MSRKKPKPKEQLLIERVNEIAVEYRKDLRKHFEGNPWGSQDVDDATFVQWFEAMMAGRYEDQPVMDPATGQEMVDPTTGAPVTQPVLVAGGPDWAPALQFVEGGQREIERYMRAKAQQQQGMVA